MQKVTVTLAPEQLNRLDDLVKQSGLNRSELTRLAVNKLLADPIIFLGADSTNSREVA